MLQTEALPGKSAWNDVFFGRYQETCTIVGPYKRRQIEPSDATEEVKCFRLIYYDGSGRTLSEESNLSYGQISNYGVNVLWNNVKTLKKLDGESYVVNTKAVVKGDEARLTLELRECIINRYKYSNVVRIMHRIQTQWQGKEYYSTDGSGLFINVHAEERSIQYCEREFPKMAKRSMDMKLAHQEFERVKRVEQEQRTTTFCRRKRHRARKNSTCLSSILRPRTRSRIIVNQVSLKYRPKEDKI